MIFFPAIDLKQGQCVRLVHGDMNQATVFNDSPAAQAKIFADAGCTWLTSMVPLLASRKTPMP